jgi:2-keto-4-pentenoate hydratase/2-oxohepta-3-ene-1,7-dioic acid hydratase in catechol pathway
MRLGTFEVQGPAGRIRRLGAQTPQGVVDVAAARVALLRRRHTDPAARRVAAAQVPSDLRQLLENGRDGINWAAEAVDLVVADGLEEGPDGALLVHDPAAITLLAPIPRPPAMSCFTTWPTHIADSASKGFSVKFPAPDGDLRAYYKGNPESVAGPGVVLSVPPYADEIDVECELAAVVLGDVKDVTVDEAERAIAGYCIFNDVSVRSVQSVEMEFGLGPTKGKDQDGGNILGPWLVTPDEVGPVPELTMSLTVNGERWSSYSAGEMAWTPADLLSYLSRGQTVSAGHVLTAGCYPGGSALDLGRKLRPGDEVSLGITGLGALVNVVGAPGGG